MSTAPISSSAPQPLRSGSLVQSIRGHSVRAKTGPKHEFYRIVAIRDARRPRSFHARLKASLAGADLGRGRAANRRPGGAHQEGGRKPRDADHGVSATRDGADVPADETTPQDDRAAVRPPQPHDDHPYKAGYWVLPFRIARDMLMNARGDIRLEKQ
jgi:hypothetical protein